MFSGYTKIFYPEAGAEGPIYYIGFMYGRLFGAYWDLILLPRWLLLQL